LLQAPLFESGLFLFRKKLFAGELGGPLEGLREYGSAACKLAASSAVRAVPECGLPTPFAVPLPISPAPLPTSCLALVWALASASTPREFCRMLSVRMGAGYRRNRCPCDHPSGLNPMAI
jgi:hypothetical protein